MFQTHHNSRPERVRGRAGFTLIELLVVISIIGVLSSIATVSYKSARAHARDAKRVSDTQQIKDALELFFEYNSH
jgi:prepilin-type N-terminal cleavage/methylation domain-containing protein